MPKLYNTPEWFTPTYDQQAQSTCSKLDSTFVLNMSDAEVLQYIHTRQLNGPSSDSVVQLSKISWWGRDYNLGFNILFNAPPFIYKHLFPSAAKAALLVHERGPSAAEDSMIPCALAESLSVEHCGLTRVKSLSDDLSPLERKAVALVLKLLASRNDNCGESALLALASYWKMYI